MSTGRIAGLLVRPASRAPTVEVPRVRVERDGAPEGDHARGGSRGVSLMEAGGWRAAAEACGAPDLPWTTRRANVLVEGLALPGREGARLRLGEVLLEITGANPPCGLMEEARAGLRAALEPDGRSGVCARVLEGGTLRVGDEASVQEPDGG